MTPAEGIRKLGFRRWYERQLIEGHVYFVTALLSTIVVAVCLEQIEWSQPMRELSSIVYIAAGVFLSMYSLRQYRLLLARAECLGGQSTCGGCATYGVLQVLEAGAAETIDGAPDNRWILVRCKKCGHEWRMEN